MKYIDESELSLLDEISYNFGIESVILLCEYKNKLYAYKKFINNELKNKIRLEKLSKIDKSYLVTPKHIVKHNNINIGYTSEYINGNTLSKLADQPIDYKIKVLKLIKKQIIDMHATTGIIHGDLHAGNFILNGNSAYIIDFDNCSIGSSAINKRRCLEQVEEYINKFGINTNLDIFTFNITTYSILYDIPFQLVRNNIYRENYGYFDSLKCKRICKSLLLDSSIQNKDFLIDNIKR